MGTGSFPGESDRCVALATHPHLAPRLKKEQSYTSTPPLGLRGLSYVELYLYIYILFIRSRNILIWISLARHWWQMNWSESECMTAYEISVYHSGVAEDSGLLGCDTVFRSWTAWQISQDDTSFLRNVGNHQPSDTASHSRPPGIHVSRHIPYIW